MAAGGRSRRKEMICEGSERLTAWNKLLYQLVDLLRLLALPSALCVDDVRPHAALHISSASSPHVKSCLTMYKLSIHQGLDILQSASCSQSCPLTLAGVKQSQHLCNPCHWTDALMLERILRRPLQ